MTVQTHPQTSRDLRLAARQGLVPVGNRGWLAGFGNMLSKELGELFRTHRWLVQLFLWVIIINGVIALMLWVIPKLSPAETLPPVVTGLMYYFSILSMTGTFGMIILAQDEVIQEKQSGTAAWILSKPASRSAFLLTKLLSNTIVALVFIVALPGVVTLVEIYLAANLVVPLVPFLMSAGVALLGLIFYLSLVILLGVLFDSRGPVLGISLGVMFGGRLATQYMPPQIAIAMPFSTDAIALGFALESPTASMGVLGVIVLAVLSIVFILIALWRFQRTEL